MCHFLSWNVLEFRFVEKSLGAYTFGHYVYTVSKIFHKVFTPHHHHPFFGGGGYPVSCFCKQK